VIKLRLQGFGGTIRVAISMRDLTHTTHLYNLVILDIYVMPRAI
jgi:hypothetical protein